MALLTFAPLQKRATILFRRLTATVLLLLFAVIYLVKLFHHHIEASYTRHSAKNEFSVAKAQTACAICDYHFTKDADATTAFAIVQPPAVHFPVRYFYILSFTTSIGLPGADRGPPALV